MLNLYFDPVFLYLCSRLIKNIVEQTLPTRLHKFSPVRNASRV
ncbi:MAG: hypothetical protein AVDCRST_MAG96-1216 [uncultured Segetibacter sp.]|uniref:Uncharacterized protein n=1 Tax=uncultured Segetibacter sp. TaxID=481133 RepID=A0A6J4S749_9BACT|nr:MAG: hypothetical protein AVDCRST_MAG96-1216 [uncultured Segetibacter sp.]